uniref:Homeobox domain-containing protein n=1 Tax=Caenorhabditis japonica TaxID=281687 RepID=A0A8R1HPS0_CAEJA
MMFTMEQLELIRRLRTTGISSDQVLKAFSDLEVPPPTNTIYSPLLVQHLTSSSVQTVPPPRTFQSEPVPTSSTAPRPIRSQRTPMKEITTLDDPNELDEFMQQGEEACILDMKAFITQYSMRQTTVAMMTGVSQPYISKLLNGNHRELSLRCRKNIYCWYLNCRRHPTKLAAFLADPSTRLETNGDGELVPQRRERYVFRPILIRMLESFFAQTPFPDLARRVEIATACNHVLQLDKKGVGLMPKEVVSPQVVSNWFANKRKELRRRSAEEGKGVASSSSASSSSSSSMLANDVASISSMSPPSRDDESTPSRNTTPETISPSPVPVLEPILPTIPAFPTTSSSPLELLTLAQRLGFQLPFSTGFLPFPGALPAAFYGSLAPPAPVLKSE